MTRLLVPGWQFEDGGIRGYVAGGGQHGVEITDAGDGLPGTRPMCLNLEHYYSRSCRSGRFVPRQKAHVISGLLSEDAVLTTIDAFQAWQVRTDITFRVLPGPLIEACYHFRFMSHFDGFEALVSNYFLDPTPPYIHLGGVWVQPSIGDREHRFWAKGREQAENIKAVYVPELAPGERIDLHVDDDYYDHPIMVTPVRQTRKSVVNMVESRFCSSLSANRLWHAHDFSLLAEDVEPGDEILCRAWLTICELESLDEAVDVYE